MGQATSGEQESHLFYSLLSHLHSNPYPITNNKEALKEDPECPTLEIPLPFPFFHLVIDIYCHKHPDLPRPPSSWRKTLAVWVYVAHREDQGGDQANVGTVPAHQLRGLVHCSEYLLSGLLTKLSFVSHLGGVTYGLGDHLKETPVCTGPHTSHKGLLVYPPPPSRQ